jgi:membrane protease YdiL (CAAX protease family)
VEAVRGARPSTGWRDAVAAFALAFAGGLAIILAVRPGWISGLVAEYLAHGWMAAIALVWFFLLDRRFPIGKFDNRALRPWYVVALILILLNLGEAVASPPGAGTRLPNRLTLLGELVFAALVVGPTEELLFRGLIQTSLNRSIGASMAIKRWRLRWGTIGAAVAFGLFHLINLGHQGLGATLEQVFAAVLIGLVIGVLYDRNHNLIGASLAHGAADLSGTAIPLVVLLLANR